MKRNQKGFAHPAMLLVLLAAAIVAAGFFVWHRHHKSDAKTEGGRSLAIFKDAPQSFDECIKKISPGDNKVQGATIDGDNLVCFWANWHTTHFDNDFDYQLEFHHKGHYPKVKTISAKLTKPSFISLDANLKDAVTKLDSFAGKNCNNGASSTEVQMAGDYVWITVGCDGANSYLFHNTSGSWERVKQDKASDCDWITKNNYPAELVSKGDQDFRVCTDSNNVERELVSK